jgi:poly(hydroxyalkanoate) depolymerase family esterase
MKRALVASLAFASAVGCASSVTDSSDTSGAALGASITEVTNFGSNPGGLKMYEYAPHNLGANAPLVLVLHGCMQSAPDAAQTGWNNVADDFGTLIVYPEQQTANNAMRCFNWAGEYGDPANLQRGKGENESIKQMVDKAMTMHSVDAKRIFIVGFSGGGATAALAAALWPDVFAGAATFAGIPYDCTNQFIEVSSCLKPGKDMSAEEWGKRVRDAMPNYTGPWPKMSLWQGSADSIVSPTNRTQLIRQWTNVHGVSATPSATDTVDGYPHSVFKDASGAVVVETYEITGMDHGVPIKSAGGKCGSPGQYTLDKNTCAAGHVADYFGISNSVQTH